MTSKSLADIHAEAIKRFDAVQSAVRDERLQCLQDRRFYSIAGAQWEGALSEQFANRPRFEVNKIHLAVIRIINEYRNNRIGVSFSAKSGAAGDKLADVCADLFRADEQDSGAEEAYDNAFEEAVGGGFGAFRLRAEYENDDDDDDRQRIRIEPIYDADSSVFFDCGARRQDKSDAMYTFVVTAMARSDYEAEFGAAPSGLEKQVSQSEFDWATGDSVFVAEYYRVDEKKEQVVIFTSMFDGSEQRVSASDLLDDDDTLDHLTATGYTETGRKKVSVRRVRKYLIDGSRVIEDCGYIAGNAIPIVPVYGKRWVVDGIERCMGHVRLAKDAQRLKNMQLSKLGEVAAYSAISKPIFTPEQVAGHQLMWAEDNIKNYPYLLINQLTDANGNPQVVGPAASTQAPDVPPAMAALLAVTEQDIAALLGNQQGGDQMLANQSGKAIELIQTRLDMQSFIYVSNFAKSLKRAAEIWLGMAKDVLIEDAREMKGIQADGASTTHKIQLPMLDESGGVFYDNDIGGARLDVAVSVGPTSTSKKQSTVRALTNMLAITTDPETQQVLQSMALLNMEGEGISDVREYFRRRLLHLGAVKPTKEEAEQMAAEAQQGGPDANTQYLQAAADQATAQANKLRADTMLSIAKADETKAKTAATLAEMDAAAREQTLQAAQALIAHMQSSGATPPDGQ